MIRSIPTGKGHNAEILTSMLPEGAKAFAGKMGKEVAAGKPVRSALIVHPVR